MRAKVSFTIYAVYSQCHKHVHRIFNNQSAYYRTNSVYANISAFWSSDVKMSSVETSPAVASAAVNAENKCLLTEKHIQNTSNKYNFYHILRSYDRYYRRTARLLKSCSCTRFTRQTSSALKVNRGMYSILTLWSGH